MTPTLNWTDPSCDENGTLLLGADDGYHWAEPVPNDDGSTTYTAVANEGFVFPGSADGLGSPRSDPVARRPLRVPRVRAADGVRCDRLPLGRHGRRDDPQPEWSPDTASIWIDINDNNARDDSDLEVEGFYGPGETDVPFALPVGFHGRLIVVTEDRTHVLDATLTIVCDYPVPAQFNAEPEPPTCETAGSFDSDFLGEPGEDGWYEFENVFVSVDRSVEGEVTLTLIAKDGFVLTGLDTEKWSVNEDGTSAERTIVLGEATGFQSDDPEAPCLPGLRLAGPRPPGWMSAAP